MSPNQDKSSEPRKLPGSWIQLPVPILEALPPHKLKIWCIVRAHCINQESWRLKVKTIADLVPLSYSQTYRYVREMVADGWLSKNSECGRSCIYSPCLPGKPLSPTIRVTTEPMSSTVKVAQDLCHGRATPFITDDKGPLSSTTNINRRESTKRTENRLHSSSDTAPRRDPSKKQRKSADSSDPRIKIVLDYFHDEHLRIHGEKSHIIGGRDGKAIKRILTTIPDVEEIKRRITAYLRDPLSWMDRPQWSISGFEKRLNAYHPDNRSANPDHESKPKARPPDLSQIKY